MNEQIIEVVREQTEQTIGVAYELTECVVAVERESITVVGGAVYDGAYNVTPTWSAQTLETNNKIMTDDVTVEAIYMSEVSNLSGGKTVYIGGII